MQDALLVNGIRKKYTALANDLDERGRRRWAAAEAESIGYGGITAVAAATGLSDRTIRTGIREIREGETIGSGRQRKPGGGRKTLEVHQPNLLRQSRGWWNPLSVETRSHLYAGLARASRIWSPN